MGPKPRARPNGRFLPNVLSKWSIHRTKNSKTNTSALVPTQRTSKRPWRPASKGAGSSRCLQRSGRRGLRNSPLDCLIWRVNCGNEREKQNSYEKTPCEGKCLISLGEAPLKLAHL